MCSIHCGEKSSRRSDFQSDVLSGLLDSSRDPFSLARTYRMHQTSSESRFFNLKFQYFPATLACNGSIDVNDQVKERLGRLIREGEAPAEPLRPQLGRSLALPILHKRFGMAHAPRRATDSKIRSVTRKF